MQKSLEINQLGHLNDNGSQEVYGQIDEMRKQKFSKRTYFSSALVAQSMASCCMSSLMSAFLITALRSDIFVDVDSLCLEENV